MMNGFYNVDGGSMKKIIKRFGGLLVVFMILMLLVMCNVADTSDDDDDDDSGPVVTTTPTPTPTSAGTTAPVTADPTLTPSNGTGALIKPAVAQDQLELDVYNFYTYWRDAYLATSNGNTPGGGYYINADFTGAAPSEWGGSTTGKSPSEAHGYGMMIFALMADEDLNAKDYFDGMYNMFIQYPSTINSNLMSWLIPTDEDTSKRSDSAIDGDMDIAYALLLAHDRWGSNGTINYLAEAQRVITNGIKAAEVDAGTKRTMLGDWDSNAYTSRTSDWMPGHFHAYYYATADSFWNDVADEAYAMISSLQMNYASATGLLPDFITGTTVQPVSAGFLEGPYDGQYSWNACRDPWRLATDYAHYGSAEAKTACNNMLAWLKTKHPDPADIKDGYSLDGTAHTSYSSLAFAAPFITACIVDSAHQDYLNAGWSYMTNTVNRESYFGDTINLLCMLLISGKWTRPGDGTPAATPIPGDPQATAVPNVNMIGNGDFSNDLTDWDTNADASTDADAIFEVTVDNALKITITAAGTETWSVGLYQAPLTIENGESYTVSFKAKADATRQINALIGQSSGAYITYGNFSTPVTLTGGAGYQEYSFNFTMSYSADSAAQIAFEFGNVGSGTNATVIYIDDISVIKQ